jgi:hypothetical protein
MMSWKAGAAPASSCSFPDQQAVQLADLLAEKLVHTEPTASIADNFIRAESPP